MNWWRRAIARPRCDYCEEKALFRCGVPPHKMIYVCQEHYMQGSNDALRAIPPGGLLVVGYLGDDW